MKFSSILGAIARICICMAGATFAIFDVGAWSLGIMVVLPIALLIFFGDGTPSDLLFWSTVAGGAIIGAMIGIGMILIDPEKARRRADSPRLLAASRVP